MRDRRTHVEIAQAIPCPHISWLAGWGCCLPQQSAEARRTAAWRAARVWHCSRGGAGGVAYHLRRSGEAHAGGTDRHRARRCSRQLAYHHGTAIRATHRAAQDSVSFGEAPPGFEKFLREFAPDLIHFHSFTLGAGIDHARVAMRLKIPYLLTYHIPAITCARGTLVRYGREVCDGLMDETKCAPCVLENQGVPLPIALVLARSPLNADRLPDKWWMLKLASMDLMRRHHQTSREFLANAAHIVSCSQWSQESLVLNGVAPEKISVHRQAMPGATRLRRLRLPVNRERTIRLGFLGRFVPDKGPDLLLKAIPYLRKQGLKVECELSGPMNSTHERWARRLLAEHASEARYLGFIPNEKLND